MKIKKLLKWFSRVLLWIIAIIIGINLGWLLGFIIWKLIMFLEILPYLEKLFSWLTF